MVLCVQYVERVRYMTFCHCNGEVCHTGDMFSGKAWVASIRTGDAGGGSVTVTAKVCRKTAAVCSGFFVFGIYPA